jgi:putative membrane protein
MMQTPIGRMLAGIVAAAVIAGVLILLAPSGLYLWIKALHILAVIAWMAGMLYLPRLFVYHCDAERGSKQSETFKVMERRLLRGIVNPAMAATWGFGLYLGWESGLFSAGWLQAKIGLVIGMSAIHGFYARAVREFAEDRNTRSQRFWRIMNEVPTLLLIAIVILAVVKPF